MVTCTKHGPAWLVWRYDDHAETCMIRFYHENRRAFIKYHGWAKSMGNALPAQHTLKRVIYQLFEA